MKSFLISIAIIFLCVNALEAAYTYKRTITIQSSQVSGAANKFSFPVLITEANLDTDFFTHCQQSSPASMDIIFMDNSETSTLYREIVHFDAAGEEFEAWVHIPTLNASANTTIYMYYGASSGVSNDTETWSSVYRGVWHLQDTPTGTSGDVSESTSNNNSGTSHNMEGTDHVTGQIGYGMSFDGNNEYIDCGTSSTLDLTGAFTLSAWIQVASASSPNADLGIASRKDALTNAAGYSMTYNTNTNYFDIYGTSSNTAWEYYNASTSWHLVAFIINGTTADMNIDGTNVPMSNSGLTAITTSTANFLIADRSNTDSELWDGLLDEVRIVNGARDHDWLTTEYNNQSAPGSFYTVGSEIFLGTPTFTPTITPTATITRTATITLTGTRTITATPTPTATPTSSITITSTMSPTPTITETYTPTPVLSPTSTPTATPTATITETSTVSPTPTVSETATVTPTSTHSPTVTITPTPNQAAANLDNVIPYPNPYRADYHTRDQITLINLPEQAIIRLYSLDGRLLQEFRKDDPGNRLVWNLTNDQGNPVASGVYVYVIKSISGSRTGKIVVLR